MVTGTLEDSEEYTIKICEYLYLQCFVSTMLRLRVIASEQRLKHMDWPEVLDHGLNDISGGLDESG